jgi:hypothetical protein
MISTFTWYALIGEQWTKIHNSNIAALHFSGYKVQMLEDPSVDLPPVRDLADEVFGLRQPTVGSTSKPQSGIGERDGNLQGKQTVVDSSRG